MVLKNPIHVILSEAKNPCIPLKINAEILRFAQNDMNRRVY